MHIPLSRLGKRLQGKPTGRKHFADICGLLARANPGEMVFLDLDNVESVNASWINMAVAPLVRWAADEQNDLFPILVHFPEKDFDELELVAEKNQQCYSVSSQATEPVPAIYIVGPLDPSLRTTLTMLADIGEATGAELARQRPDAGILPTAWNNRLKELYDKRLLVRRKQGRQQVYSPLARKVVLHG